MCGQADKEFHHRGHHNFLARAIEVADRNHTFLPKALIPSLLPSTRVHSTEEDCRSFRVKVAQNTCT